MKKILIAALTPFVLTMPVMASLPSFAEGSGLTLLAQGTNTVKQMAQGFTVKILVGDTNGSGVIIGKTGNTYRVVTNAHVVTRSNTYKIQAPDGKVYTGKLLEKGSSLQGNDLAILSFESSVNYAVATLADGGTLKPNEVVYSAGFPIDQSNFMITSGMITEVTSQPLKGGYQLGYSADTLQGMSGGPLLNSAGQLIGIVGMGKGAALTEAYTYQDESRPAIDVINQWRGMSFAVPVATINQIAGDVAKVPSGEGKAVAKAKNYTGIVKKVDDIAQQVTVRIDYQEDGKAVNGSGTIIGKEGNTYSVLTACHVVSRACKSENLIDNWVIMMPDGEKITVKSGKDAVTILNPAYDVAVMRFNSSKNYAVATIGNYTTKGKQWLLMTGFPGKDQSKQRLLTAGTVQAKERAAFVAKDQHSMGDGQELVYTNQSSGGMSGGGVFDTEGRLVGVNTGSENAPFIEQGEYQEIGLGYSLGVPITTFLGIAEAAKFSTQNFPKVANPAVEVNANEIQQIKAQLFHFQVLQSGATVADWVNYGNALWRSGEYTEAAQAFDRAITLLGKEGKGENLANIYYAKGLALGDFGQSLILTNNQKAREKSEEALTTFQQATKTFSNFPNAWRWQGVILNSLQRYPEALIAYEQAMKGNAQDFVPYVERANVLKELKRYPEALASYGQAINLKSNHPWAYNNRGTFYADMGEKDLALKDYNQAIKLDPKFAGAYHNRGTVYSENGEKKLALQDFNQAIEIDPKFAMSYYSRGRYYDENGDKELALLNYNYAILLDYQSALVYLNRGRIFQERGNKELALQDYNHAIKLNPEEPLVYNNRGNIYRKSGEKELALQDYNHAIKLDPKFAMAHMNRGNLYRENGEKELALQDYNHAIKLDPKFVDAYYNRGIFYYENGEKELALNDYNQAIKLNPQSVEVYVNRGVLYKEIGKKELALQDYNQAININPQLAKAYLNRGVLYAEKGEKDLALNDYNQAIKIDPQFAGAYNNRGNIYKENGEKELALKDYNQAIKLNSQLAQAYVGRGFTYLEINNRQQAIQDLKTAVKLLYEQGNPAYQQILEMLKQLEQ
jgi:tetratricopeptide (TPR) repeat protein/V8-like Glu-specific endopeptidase